MSKKNPFADLPSDFKDAVADLSPDEIRLRIADIALHQMELKRQRKLDKQLQEAKSKVEQLAEKYKTASALNTLKLKLFPSEKLTPPMKVEVADLALAEVELEQTKEDDQDLRDAQDSLKFANEGYSDQIKGSKLRIKFCRQVLKDKGAL